MYQALYRKWRPRTFDEVVGQSHVTETLCTQVKTGKLSHAYLFVGSRGTGKTTCARILARAVNCENPQNGNPCCKCPACVSILDGTAPEIVEIDAASNNGVDDVRALRDEAVYSPALLKKRVYIIDEVHMLSKPAFNALLKILEEPPSHLLFVLATTELNKVPATILSRCQRFNFKRISNADIATYLKYVAGKENLELHDDAAELLAGMAEGGMRDALSLLDQCASSDVVDLECVKDVLGIASNAVIQQMLKGIFASDTDSVVRSFEKLWDDGKSPASVLKDLSTLIRDTLMIKVLKKGAENLLSGRFDYSEIKELAALSDADNLIVLLNEIIGGINTLGSASNPHIAAELCLISMCCSPSGQSLENRVKKLEEVLETGALTVKYEEKTAEKSNKTLKKDVEIIPPLKLSITETAETEEKEVKQETDKAVEETEPAKSEEAKDEDNSGDITWKRIVEAIQPALPIDMSMTISNPAIVSGSLANNVLTVNFEPGYAYARFNSGETAALFKKQLKDVLNLDVRIVFEEGKNTAVAEKTRSLDELRNFGIVNFVD